MNNVVLVQTHDLIVNRYLPLAIGNIWVYAHQSEYVRKNYKIADVIIDKIDPEEYIESIDFIPNVFAFSVYLWNFKHTKSFAKTIKKGDAEDFASTKHKGLPNKVKKETKVRNLIKKMVREIMKEDFAGSYPKEMR